MRIVAWICVETFYGTPGPKHDVFKISSKIKTINLYDFQISCSSTFFLFKFRYFCTIFSHRLDSSSFASIKCGLFPEINAHMPRSKDAINTLKLMMRIVKFRDKEFSQKLVIRRNGRYELMLMIENTVNEPYLMK